MGYLGSKAADGTFQAIIAAMPPHDTYIETHLGSGAVMRAKPPAPLSIGIDIDPCVTMSDLVADLVARDVELVVDDCVDFLDGFDMRRAGRLLIYADPPYVMATRSSRHRYRFDYEEVDHRRLIACLRAKAGAGAMVMISGYPSALYDQLLGDWRRLSFQAMTRGGVRTECVWLNFPETAGAHWATYAGENFTRRQNIKRKAERWAAMYRRLKPGERLALLARLLEEESAIAAAGSARGVDRP